ncbi:Peptidoglycan deacetylase [Thalassocella blandensis]|nr:Peptidoglycan deacetylase [Thalassocella blandensis]
MHYPRDMIGYGKTTPAHPWPDKAKIAVQFVLNYEEGAENCLLHGDEHSETFLSEIIGARAYPARHMSMESLYEYGSRAGFWRLHRLFNRYQIPVTVYGVAMALARNPDAVAAMQESHWEIASHAYRWIDHQFMDQETERDHIAKAVALHTEITGAPPLGWYTGRDSPNTRALILQQGGFLYDSDSYADDLPYWHSYENEGTTQQHLIIPYTLDTNDMRFTSAQGFNSGEQFYQYLRDCFDVLYEEGEYAPKMMSVGLHCRIIGRPARIRALENFIQHIQQHQDVWICRRVDIARHWHQHYKP